MEPQGLRALSSFRRRRRWGPRSGAFGNGREVGGYIAIRVAGRGHGAGRCGDQYIQEMSIEWLSVIQTMRWKQVEDSGHSNATVL